LALPLVWYMWVYTDTVVAKRKKKKAPPPRKRKEREAMIDVQLGLSFGHWRACVCVLGLLPYYGVLVCG
jgi:hypothetical protein